MDIREYRKNGYQNVKGENIFCEVPNCQRNSVYKLQIVYDFKDYYLCDKHYLNYHNFMVHASTRMALDQKKAIDRTINGEESTPFTPQDKSSGSSGVS